MRIYRLENKQGKGPYSGSCCQKFAKADIHKKGCCSYEAAIRNYWGAGFPQPLPVQDFQVPDYNRYVGNEYEIYRFGFLKRADIEAWFGPDALEDLFKLGFTVRIYSIPKRGVIISKSRRQVIFDNTQAEYLDAVVLEAA